MTTFETPMALLAIAGVMAAALFCWDTNSQRERLDLSTIAEIAGKTRFDLSCSPDGRLDDRRTANCFERNGYRFIRDGGSMVIAHVGTNGTVELVYNSDMTKRFSSIRALSEARTALVKSLETKKNSQPE